MVSSLIFQNKFTQESSSKPSPLEPSPRLFIGSFVGHRHIIGSGCRRHRYRALRYPLFRLSQSDTQANFGPSFLCYSAELSIVDTWFGLAKIASRWIRPCHLVTEYS